MVDKRQLVQLIRTALALFLGLALIASPLASTSAMAGHGLSSHERAISKPGAQLENADQPAALPCPHHGVDHRACCGTACGPSVLAIDAADAALLDLNVAHPQYAWYDQFVSGVAFPPLLGPPRRQA
jgi:hypothetical protein